MSSFLGRSFGFSTKMRPCLYVSMPSDMANLVMIKIMLSRIFPISTFNEPVLATAVGENGLGGHDSEDGPVLRRETPPLDVGADDA